jgi:outer membrane protein assembly complex protein YaeT
VNPAYILSSGSARARVRRLGDFAGALAALFVLVTAAPAASVTLEDLPARGTYVLAGVDVEIEGQVAKSDVRGAMLTKLPPLWKPWERWWKDTPFNPDVFETDLERVRAELRRSGHYAATVDYDLALDGDAVSVTVRIDAGPAVEVDTVTIAAEDFTPSDEEKATLRRLVPFEEGDVFREEAYAQAQRQLEAHYENQGFAYAAVTRHARVDTGTRLVAVTYAITRGRTAVFGTTSITGTEDVSDALVRRELTYEQGDTWDPRELEKTQAQVFGLKLFRAVTVKPTSLDARNGVVDVAVDVSEGPSHELKIGVGYGLEDGPRGQLRWQDYDFHGGGRQLGLQLKASLIEQTLESEFRQPFFLAPTQTLIVPLTSTREDEPAFMVQRIKLAPRIERKFGTTFRIALGYDLEYDDLSDVPGATPRRLEEFEGRGFVSSLTALVERNTTTDLLDPHDGSIVTLEAEQAGGPWQGDFSFYRATLEAKRYWPVLGPRVIAARARIGTADAFGQSEDVPLFRRFYAGGINSTRGYDRWMLGPLNDDDDPVGGRSLLEGSIEFRTPIWGDLGGVVFFDVGEVRRRPHSWTVGDLQFGTGVGVRYHTIVGPLRLDLGFPVPEAPPGEASWQIHFSIGQAF